MIEDNFECPDCGYTIEKAAISSGEESMKYDIIVSGVLISLGLVVMAVLILFG